MSVPAPAGSVDPLAPIIVAGGDGGGPTGGDSGSGSDPSPTSGFGGVSDLGAPIAYAAGVLLVALVIARRRLERQERATASAALADPDSTPVPRAAPPERPLVADDEANLPRWLRPSLRAERFGMDQSRSRVLPAALRQAPPTRTPMSFGRPPEDGVERRVIVAERLGLLASPGEATAQALAEVERADEVEILDVDGLWSKVLTPTGLAGWLPTSVLGAPSDVVPGPVLPAWAAGPAAPGWATPDQPVDLAAILAAGRARPETGT